jgi:ATP-dependent DNA helicase RecG
MGHIPPPTPAEFAQALSGWEGQYVEFKEAVSDSLARELVAFANAAGGRIYLGITDDKQVKGIALANHLLSRVQNDARHCEPPISIHMAAFRYQGQDLLMIDVPEGRHKPYGCSAGYFLRTGPNTQKLNRDELVGFVHALKPAVPERQDCPDFRYPADFDKEQFQAFLRLSGASTQGLAAEHLLTNLGFARRDGKRCIFNNAGALFFARRPARFLPQARVTCVLFQTPERLHVLDRKDLDGGLLDNLRQAEIFLLKHLPVRYEIRGFERIEHPELPVEVLREGLVNALMHRDYALRGGNVFVEVFPDRVAIVSPGGLPPGLVPEEFGTKSVHRNPLIADILFRARQVERIGTGVRRMRELLAQAGCQEPRFKFTSFFELSLPRPRAKEGASRGASQGGKWGESPTRIGGTSRGRTGGQVGGQVAARHAARASAILAFCRDPRTLREIMAQVGIRKRDHASAHLRSLMEARLLALTVPDKPRSRRQKYRTTALGMEYAGQ